MPRSQRTTQRLVVDFANLLDAAAEEEPWAIEMLADEYLPRLTAFARSRGAVDPDGIADVALTSVLPRLSQLQFEAREQLWAYLCLTARSRIIDDHRRSRPLELIGDDELADKASPAPGSFDDRVVDADYVAGLLSVLTDEQRQVLELRFLEDLSIEETANLTGRTQGAVKGLQRRAINALIAAVAVLLAVLAIRGLGDRVPETEADLGPVNGIEENTRPDGSTDLETRPTITDGDLPQPENSDGEPSVTLDDDATGEDTLADGALAEGALSDGALAEGDPDPDGDPDPTQGDDPGAEVTPGAGAEGEPTEGGGNPGTGAEAGPESEVAPGAGEPSQPAAAAAPVRLSAGTGVTATMNTSGARGQEPPHGARIRCVASHLSHDDPIEASGQPGASPARVYWGNTETGANSGGRRLATSGNSTCDGGVSDRSAYWMPALFTEADRAAVPSAILVEYKSFGGTGFDRQTLQPLPAGLQLVADPAIINRFGTVGSVSRAGAGMQLSMLFPSCVQVDAAGGPVLSSANGISHLSYRSPDEGRANECPASHPYRIPQLSYLLTYDVPFGSAWYLADDASSTGSRAPITASAVLGWQPSASEDVLRCVRDLLTDCWFAKLATPLPTPTTGLADGSFTP